MDFDFRDDANSTDAEALTSSPGMSYEEAAQICGRTMKSQ
jgi:hypothetical protein